MLTNEDRELLLRQRADCLTTIRQIDEVLADESIAAGNEVGKEVTH
jgi:hypothetical protein